jgi:alpha-D-ribose 1-methylphosphonate 5-triphosphate synthase subunit PhnG
VSLATDAPAAEPATDGRRDALAVLARAGVEELRVAWDALGEKPGFETVRPPETGLVMTRGRMGGGGAPFNIGEVTVTRAVVRMETGEVGFGHILGRDPDRAMLVACFDALWQNRRYRDLVEAALIAPVRQRGAEADDLTRRKTAATRVNFFTLVRGEDE